MNSYCDRPAPSVQHLVQMGSQELWDHMRLTLNLALAAKYQPEGHVQVERVVTNPLARTEFRPDRG